MGVVAWCNVGIITCVYHTIIATCTCIYRSVERRLATPVTQNKIVKVQPRHLSIFTTSTSPLPLSYMYMYLPLSLLFLILTLIEDTASLCLQVFSKETMEAFVVRHILPKLAYCLQSMPINPHHQDIGESIPQSLSIGQNATYMYM